VLVFSSAVNTIKKLSQPVNGFVVSLLVMSLVSLLLSIDDC
jgi:hypothetical protein